MERADEPMALAHPAPAASSRGKTGARRNAKEMRRMGSDAGMMIVTGGGRGIGAATARLAAERGYAVCVNYRARKDSAEALVAEIRAGRGRAAAVAGDVAKEADVVALFD